jgi:hypothetical protein
MEAASLGEILQRRRGQTLDGLPAEFFSANARVVKTPWLMATGEDLRYPGTEGDRPGWTARLVQLYITQIINALPLDTVLGTAMAQVIQLVKPPQSLFHPRILSRVLAYTLRGIHADEQLNAPVISPVGD